MGKRADGEGLLRQRKTGSKLWEARVVVPGEKPRSVYARTQKEVLEKRRKAVEAVEAGRPVDSVDWTVGAYLDTWLYDPQRGFRARTTDRYESAFNVHVKPHLGRIKLAALTPLQVKEWLTRLGKYPGLADGSVANIRACLRSALEEATRIELIPRNPVALTKAPPASSLTVAALTPSRAREILRAVDGSSYRDLYYLALYTGMRRGELLGLRWVDVSEDPAAVRIQHALHWQGGEPVLAATKTKRGARMVPLFPPAVDALDRQRLRQAQLRDSAGQAWRDTGLVFTSRDGGALTPRCLGFDLTPRLKAAGLPHMRFHDLRHGYATLLTAAGVHPRMLMELMGHASIRIGQDRYAHVAPDSLHEAMRELSGFAEARSIGTTAVPQSDSGARPAPGQDARDFLGGVGAWRVR